MSKQTVRYAPQQNIHCISLRDELDYPLEDHTPSVVTERLKLVEPTRRLAELKAGALVAHLTSLKQVLQFEGLGETTTGDITGFVREECSSVMTCIEESLNEGKAYWSTVENSVAEAGFPTIVVGDETRLYVTRRQYILISLDTL